MIGRSDDCSEEDHVPCGVLFGRACGYCLMNHYDIPVFLLSFLILYLSVNRCCYCDVLCGGGRDRVCPPLFAVLALECAAVELIGRALFS